VPKLRIIRIY